MSITTLARSVAAAWRARAAAPRQSGAFVAAAAREHENDPSRVLGNPLRNLTATRAAQLLEAAVRGEWTQVQWLVFHAEQRDPDLMALIAHRLGALQEMDWNVKISEKAKRLRLEPEAKRQKDALLSEYEKIENLYEGIAHLATASFRGFAHVARDGNRLEPLDQWWFVRDGLYGPWFWNPGARLVSARNFRPEDALDERQFLIRTEPRAVLFWAVIKFLYSVHGLRWWSAFCETISKQGTVIIGPDGMTDEQAARFEANAIKIAGGASGALPWSSQVVHPNANRGPTPYDAWMRYLSEKLVLAGTGGKLTMLNDATGIGGSQSETHGETFKAIARAEARTISEIFQRQFDAPLLRQHFPGQPVLAYWEIAANEDVDVDAIVQNVLALSQAGYQVEPEQVSEKTGYRLSLKPQPAPAPFGGYGAFGNRRLANRSAAAESLAGALGVGAEWLEPIASLLADLEAKAGAGGLSAADAAAALEDAARTLPELFGEMDVDAFADWLERGLGQAALSGAREGLRAKKTSPKEA